MRYDLIHYEDWDTLYIDGIFAGEWWQPEDTPITKYLENCTEYDMADYLLDDGEWPERFTDIPENSYIIRPR